MRELKGEEIDFGTKGIEYKKDYVNYDVRCPPGYIIVKEYNTSNGTFVRNHCRKRSRKDGLMSRLTHRENNWVADKK